MTTPEDLDANDAAFPDIVDDAYPENDRVPEPQRPALPGDTLLGADAVGTTVEEQLEGESLDHKLGREIPDDLGTEPLTTADEEDGELSYDEDGGRLAGRLVEPDEGASGDYESDMIASEVTGSGDSTTTYDASPEEQAMHIVYPD